MIPKYVGVQREIINYIATNQMRIGDALPSEKELARLLDVSLITIRRAMLELANRSIVERRHGVGTFVKTDLEETAEQGEVVLLQVSQNEVSPFGVGVDVPQVQQLLTARGHRLKVLSVGRKVDTQSVELLHSADAVLASGFVTDDWIQLLDSLDIPTVLVGNIPANPRNLPLVAYDWRKMTELVVEELIEQGCKSIGICLGTRDYAPSREMVAGIRSVLASHGRDLPEEDIYYTHGYASETIRDFLSARTDLDGLVLERATCVHVLASLLMTERRPKLGILSVSPSIKPVEDILFEAAFQEDVYEKSVETLFTLKNSTALISDILIQPYLC